MDCEGPKTGGAVPSARLFRSARGAGLALLGTVAALGLVIAASLYSDRLWQPEQAADPEGQRTGSASRPEAKQQPSASPKAGPPTAAKTEGGEAEAALVKACDRDPTDAATRASLAELYLTTNRRLAEAAALAKKAAELQPTAPHFWLLARTCRQAGDVPAALAALDRAIELDPGNLLG